MTNNTGFDYQIKCPFRTSVSLDSRLRGNDEWGAGVSLDSSICRNDEWGAGVSLDSSLSGNDEWGAGVSLDSSFCRNDEWGECCTLRSFLRYSAPQGLDPAAAGFAVQSLLPGAFGGCGRTPDLPRYGNASDQFLQALQGVGSILLPGPVFSCLDDHHAVHADAAVPQVQQALLIQFRQ